jgi:tRNA(Ile)-lysidine synthetase-like protein
MYRQAGGELPALSRRHIKAMERLLASAESRSLDLPAGITFSVEAGRASMRLRGTRAVPRPYVVTVRDCDGCDDADAVHLLPGLDLSVGFRRPGLRIRPLGGQGSRKLQDILVDARIPRSERDAFPLLFANGKLAWVPGLAIAAEFAAVPGGRSEHVMLESGHRPSQGVSL